MSRAAAALLILTTLFSVVGCRKTAPAPADKELKPVAAAPDASPAHKAAPTALPSETHPLFDRLGGTTGIAKIVDDFVTLAAADPKVNFTRKGTPNEWSATPAQLSLLKKRLVEFLSATTGSDARYNGNDMVTSHKGMNITETEFDAFVVDLQQALSKNKVRPTEQAELIALVNRTRSAIVAQPGEKMTPAAPVEKQMKLPAPAPTPVETELEDTPPAAKK